MSDEANALHEACYLRASQNASVQTVFKTFRRTPMLTLQPETMPCLSIYLLRDLRTPDGDANAGPPRFKHMVHVGFSGAVLANNEDKHLLQIDKSMSYIDTVLLNDPTFVAMIEGVEQIDRRYVFSRAGELPLSEIQKEYVFSFRSTFEPQGLPDFEGVEVQAAPWPNTGQAQPIIRRWLWPETDTGSGGS
jgi:hypothetical protein